MYGKEEEKARTKTRDLTDALRKKKPDAVFFRITEINFTEQPLSFLVAGQGLFESKYIVLFDNVFSTKDFKEEIIGMLAEIKDSEHVFVILEKDIDKKTLDKLEKHAAKMQEFASGAAAEKAASGKKAYNPFALSDALLNRNRKDLWMLLLEAKQRGTAAEETHGIIWWQMKAVKLAIESKDAKEADLSPFVFTKAKRAEKIFSKEELGTMLFQLTSMYHDAHRGEKELWDEMEKWALTL
jgi:DNA polymerase III delta subunit